MPRRIKKSRSDGRSLIVAILLTIVAFNLYAQEVTGPFPVKGPIYDGNEKEIGEARVYPRYVEIFDANDRLIGKVGVLEEKGIARLFLVGGDVAGTLVGYADRGWLYDRHDELRGQYFWTPTWSFVYDKTGKRMGSVKCIAWPRVCAAGVGGFLLNLYGGEGNDQDP
jgi:hypothetical protein